MMTREEYRAMWQKLRGRGWRKNKSLRCAKDYCPIVAAADEKGGLGFEGLIRPDSYNFAWRLNNQAHYLGGLLGLRPALITGIVRVADGMDTIDGWVENALFDRPELKPIYREALHDALDPLFEETSKT